jgi:RimJ/RimL family protein N-acetyltransferase
MPSIFEGRLIRLRAVEPGDWELHHKWDQDTEAARLDYEISFPRNPAGTQAWAERESRLAPENDVFRFQIETLDGVLAGTINTNNCNLRNGTFMYGLAVMPPHRRKGYASEAIRLVLRFYFGERRYQKCSASVYSFNTPSQKLHEALGFTLEGRLRRMIYSGGEYHDALIYGITREEFDALHGG